MHNFEGTAKFQKMTNEELELEEVVSVLNYRRRQRRPPPGALPPIKKFRALHARLPPNTQRPPPAMSSSSRPSSPAPEETIELPAELAQLSLSVDEKPESLATGSKDIQLAALKATKYVFDLGKPVLYTF